jgi:hypothetical protein
MKIFGGIGLLMISALSLMYYMLGMHGRLMFRPHMAEDWVIWGVAVVSAILGLILIIRVVRRKKWHEQI